MPDHHDELSSRPVKDTTPLSDDDARKWTGLPTVTPDITKSRIASFYGCERYFLFSDRFGLRLGARDYSSPPEIGTLAHLNLATRILGGDSAAAIRATNSHAHAMAAKFRDECRNDQLADNVYTQIMKDLAVSQALSEIYWRRFPLNSLGMTPIAVEEDIRVKLTDINHHIGGILDVIFMTDNGYLLWDFKTTSRPPNKKTTSLGWSTEIKMYSMLAAGSDLPEIQGKRPLGFVHSFIQVPTIRQKMGQSLDDFIEECADWYEGKDDTKGTVCECSPDNECKECGGTGRVRFKSGPRKGLPKPRWEHAENAEKFAASPPMLMVRTALKENEQPYDGSFKTMVHTTARACRALPLLSSFPQSGEPKGMCSGRGDKPCQFALLCGTDVSNWKTIIDNHYHISTGTDSGNFTED